MNISNAGITVMHHYEQCSLEAYPDPGSRDGHPWTIGWGHTGPEVVPGLQWTQAQADRAFIDDVGRFENGVSDLVKVKLEQGQFDALVSFAYNLGLRALRGSTLLRKLNAGDYAGAAQEFAKWVRNDGNVMRGLVRRRSSEKALFIGATAEEAIRIGNLSA